MRLTELKELFKGNRIYGSYQYGLLVVTDKKTGVLFYSKDTFMYKRLG